MTVMFKGRKVINLNVDGVDGNDYPDFCDAYFCYGEYEDGTELTDDDLLELCDTHGDVLHEMAYEHFM